MTDNTEQKEFWNDLKGDLWVELQTKIDPMLAVFDEKLLEVLDVQKGERALEIGCGTGTTTLKMADRLGPNGSIHALDFSQPMIGRAKERAVEAPWTTLFLWKRMLRNMNTLPKSLIWHTADSG